MAPILKAIGGEDYWRRSDFGADIGDLESGWALYSGFALDWMRMSSEWWQGTKHHDGELFEFGRTDYARYGTNDWGVLASAWIDTGYLERWDSITPPWTPTVPDQATRQMFTLTGLDSGFEFRLDDVPHDGWSRITDIQIQVNGGAWIPTGITQIGDIYTHDLASSAYLVAMRAVNAYGAGAASGAKPPTKGDDSKPPVGGGSGAGGGGVVNPRTPPGDTASPRSPRIAPPSAGLATLPSGLATDFVRSSATVPVPASLLLLLGAIGSLGVLSLRRRSRQAVPNA